MVLCLTAFFAALAVQIVLSFYQSGTVLRELDGPTVAKGLPAHGALPVAFDGIETTLPLPRLARAILQRVDGVRSFGAIADELAANGVSREAFARDLAALRKSLEALNRLPVGNNANLAQAVENVRQAILAKRLRRGTAAITNGGQGNFGSDGSFTNPNFSTGGGSSNYGQ